MTDTTLPQTKLCSKCDVSKPLAAFSPHKHYKYGRNSWCKSCVNEYGRVRSARADVKAQRKQYYDANRDHLMAVKYEWRKTRSPEVWNAYNRNRNARMRLEVLARYGGFCTCCGEAEFRFLTIDHVNNDGAEHRRERGGGQGNGTNIYRWLKAHHFPVSGFQVLCYNCNCAKAITGECPHKLITLINFVPLEQTCDRLNADQAA